MAESTEDKDVDALITQMQSTLDKLKAAQRKDVKDEDAEESSESSEESSEDESRPPLQRAERKAQRLRAREKNSDTKSES